MVVEKCNCRRGFYIEDFHYICINCESKTQNNSQNTPMKFLSLQQIVSVPERHKLRIIDSRITRNGNKLYGVICSRCHKIVEAGVSYEEAEAVIRTIRTGK